MDYCGMVQSRGYGKPDRGQYHEFDEILSARGAAMVVRRDVYKKVGGFDKDFFINLDDADFGWRIWIAGYRVVFVPDSIVYHRGSSSPRRAPYAAFHDIKNRYFMMLKNYGMGSLYYIFLRFLVIELMLYCPRFLMEAFHALRPNHPVQSAVIKHSLLPILWVKALLWIMRNMRKIWKKRMEVQYLLRKRSDEYIKSNMMKRLQIISYVRGNHT